MVDIIGEICLGEDDGFIIVIVVGNQGLVIFNLNGFVSDMNIIGLFGLFFLGNYIVIVIDDGGGFNCFD